MRYLNVDMDFLTHVLECFKEHRIKINLLGGEPGLIKNLEEVCNKIKEYDNFKLSILSNSLIRKFYPWVLDDPHIYYVEHLVLDFYEDKIEKLGNYDFFEENDKNNYNGAVKELNAFVLKIVSQYQPVVQKARAKFEKDATNVYKIKEKIFNKWRKTDGSTQGS